MDLLKNMVGWLLIIKYCVSFKEELSKTNKS